jgi:PAS domain S-box-containing protein
MKTTTPKKSDLSHSETEKLLTIFDTNLKQLQNIFQNSPAAIAIFNGPEHKFIMANLKYQKQNNRTENDLLGRTFQEVFPELNGTGTYEIFDNVFKTGETYTSSEYPALIDSKNNGIPELCYFNFSLEALKNESDEIYGLMVMALDITKHVELSKKSKAIEERFRNLVAQSPMPMLVLKGENMIFDIANEPMLKLWHVGKEAIGKSMLEIMPEIKKQPFWEYLLNVFHNGITKYGKEQTAYFIRKNGQKDTLYFNYVYQPYYEDNGNIYGVIVTANDVTEQVLSRKKIEESEHKYQNLIFTSPYMIAIFKGKNLIIEIANDAILETWGKGKDVIGKSFYDILPEAVEQGFHKLILKVLETGKPYHAYETPITLWRNEKWELMHYNFIYQAQRNMQGKIEGVAILANEVTPQVIAKNELILAKNDAEIKTEIAENAVQAKQQFLSNMSHEIRTPMNAIVGFTNVILKTELNDSQKQYIDAVKVSSDALVILIDDILDLAKVDAGKMTFEKITFDLADCIHKIALLFELKLKEKKLKFNLNLDGTIPNQIIGDPTRLRQIILNLLSNAIKFTNAGSISFDVKVLTHSKNKINIEFKIIDTGIGIASDKLEAIFNNFEQAHAETSANYGGTGLGLAIVKKLVENQGGTIFTKSDIGKGSTFSFNLSFDTNDLQDNLPKETTANNMIYQSATKLKNIKILVAEDVALNQLLIKVVLGNFNFEVDIADNGKFAIEKIKTNTYDLILMDLHMPEMDGLEATKYIREEMKSQIPIIALTADVTQVDIDKCLAIGMQDHISKPIDEKLLYEKIFKVLNDNQK